MRLARALALLAVLSCTSPDRIVKSAEGSKEAESLARSVTGMVYEGMMRLALCSDGTAGLDQGVAAKSAYNSVAMGNSGSRRGRWDIVLYGGAPAIRAQWERTATRGSVTRYFRVEPGSNGSGARVDGIELTVGGTC